jgi:hypothetical protein
MSQIPFLHSSSQKYPSWIYVIPFDCWTPPAPMPELTQEQIDQNYEYQWNEEIYQQNGAMGNSQGWTLIKKSI